MNVFRIIHNKNAFWIAILCLALIIPLTLWGLDQLSWWPWHNSSTSYFQYLRDSLGAIILGIFIAWYNYHYEKENKNKLGLPKDVTIRIPLMLACSPLFTASNRNIFEQYHIGLKLDFRYSGMKALQDLKNGHCKLAVASDMAIASFLNDDIYFDLYFLPFVTIQDHLKIVVLEYSSINNISDLKDKTIARVDSSVHDHYLNSLNIGHKSVSKSSVMECHIALINGEVDACILWEPHYLTVNKYRMRILDTSKYANYTWHLCLVAEKKYLDENLKVMKNILSAMHEAAQNCNDNYDDILKDSIFYMLADFTGATQQDMQEYFLHNSVKKHHFGIDNHVLDKFDNKIKMLSNDQSYKGAITQLRRDYWPGVNNKKS